MSDQYRQVFEISDLLLDHLVTPAVAMLVEEANRPGQSSALVQAAFQPFAASLGFTSEARGLFAGTEHRGLRPDYFRPLDDSGILLEVERGKTTINNMDLLDLWKCHICVQADYLFLLVPQLLRQNLTKRPTTPCESVVSRMRSFFLAGNYVNVRGVHVFGY